MAFNTTPVVGVDLDYNGPIPYYDAGKAAPSPKLGTKVVDDTGHERVWVQASANIAALASPGTAVTITEPAFTAAAGAGGFNAPVAGVTSGNYFWARRTAL